MDERFHTSGNPELLRCMIDAGKTFDKVRFSDPAAAPLGTDDEAGGFPPSAAQVSEAIRLETLPLANEATRDAAQEGVWPRILPLLGYAVLTGAVALLVLVAVR
jgi:hypothetical protein